ncbi:MAG: diaminopimelate decarboxylase [Oscillospiraceae bacterium]|jgi:diaminopimelate decarboxylase|nr:diaminopimelate decarboxylase [Oscillospiraceae bacterium]
MNQTLKTGSDGRLLIGGLAASDIAGQYGTPVYIVDEDAITAACGAFTTALAKHYPGNARAAFASKALCFTYIYRVVQKCGFAADVASSGEAYTALRAGMNPEDLIFHGNNKTLSDLEYALENKIGRIVVDNFTELSTLDALCERLGKTANIALRLNPAVNAQTHEFVRVGGIDSKFGFAIGTGDALAAVRTALASKRLKLGGIHCHIGSQIMDSEPFEFAAQIMVTFMKRVLDETGYLLKELNLGGGFGVRYTDKDAPRGIEDAVRTAAETVVKTATELDFPLPLLMLEPGRSIVAEAGITVYTVGSVKEIPGVRTYVAVDGGMGDNPRYALYGAKYDAVLADNPHAPRTRAVTVAGRNCEADTLIKDIALPELKPGDLLCVLTTGAFNYSMASNYNRVPRPPVVMVKGGETFVAVRRETFEDLTRCDL